VSIGHEGLNASINCSTVLTWEVEIRIVKAMLGVAMLGSLLFVGSAAFAASTPAGGAVKVFARPGMGAGGTIVITGAIGDYGKTLSIDKNGKTDPNGKYVKITLKQGSFEGNSTALNAKTRHLAPAINKTTCSASLSGTGPVSLFNGAGLYKGISGTVRITETFAFIAPRFTSGKHKGQCNFSNNAPVLSQYSSITGSGNVKFS
jgi:hypothetical protein